MRAKLSPVIFGQSTVLVNFDGARRGISHIYEMLIESNLLNNNTKGTDKVPEL